MERSRSQRPYPATPVVQTRNKYKIKYKNKQRSNSVVGRKNKKKEPTLKVTKRMMNPQYISDQNAKISFAVQNVQNTIKKLDKTHHSLKNDIQQKFEIMMIKMKEQQLSLEQGLEDIIKMKKDILKTQLNQLKVYKDQFKMVQETYHKHNNIDDVLSFLNGSQNQKYNISSIQSAVSSNIIFEFNKDEIHKSISQWGSVDSAEVPLYAPIIKAIHNTGNSIEVKCVEPKRADDQVLDITKFEIEYILIPKQYKRRWKKTKNNIFDELDHDDHKESISSIVIDNNKDFKRNTVLINDLQFNCDYLIRARCYNVCGFGPWSPSPKQISIYDISKEGGHWKFDWEYFTENMTATDSDKTITKTSGKNDWDCVAQGPCFPTNFIESRMKIYWNIRINECYSADKGSLHFGIMYRKTKPEDVWSESIGFAEYESIGMEKYEQSPSFGNSSVVHIVVDFKLLIVEFYEEDVFLASQKLSVLKHKISDLCFGMTSYRKKNSISLM